VASAKSSSAHLILNPAAGHGPPAAPAPNAEQIMYVLEDACLTVSEDDAVFIA
jgi:hypothetical protein